jgi:hypothetical protein
MSSNKLSLLLFCFFGINMAFAQNISINADLVSRYIWRGLDLSHGSPSIQPSIKFSAGGFTAGFWGAYSFANSVAQDEIDFYASYSLAFDKYGSIGIGLTDYMAPANGTPISNFANHDDHDGPGAHSIELNLFCNGPGSFPISISLNKFFHNVPNNPFYFHLVYFVELQGVGISFFAGGTTGDSAKYYGARKFSLVNVGFTTSKVISISENLSLPLFGSIALNPSTEKLFYVVGFSL